MTASDRYASSCKIPTIFRSKSVNLLDFKETAKVSYGDLMTLAIHIAASVWMLDSIHDHAFFQTMDHSTFFANFNLAKILR